MKLRSIYFIMVITILSVKSYSKSDTLIYRTGDYNYYSCFSSQIPLFTLPVDSLLEIEIKTDFEKIYATKKEDQKRIDGTIKYRDKNNTIEIPIRIKARGNTRFEFCKYKPLDIKFDSIIENTIFEGLQNKISIVTHCGQMEGEQWIFKASDSEYKNKMFAEYYLYSILEQLNTITRSVSLCKIKYINANDSVLTQDYAFILESYSEVAKRCRLQRNKEKVKYIDETTLINTKLMNRFITNNDWKYEYSDSLGWTGHNLKFLMSRDSIFYPIPYDFDLTALMYPDYWKNKTESFDDHCNKFYDFITEQFSDQHKLPSLYYLYTKIPSIKFMIENSYMDDELKDRFDFWIESYEFILYEHLIQFRKYRKLLI